MPFLTGKGNSCQRRRTTQLVVARVVRDAYRGLRTYCRQFVAKVKVNWPLIHVYVILEADQFSL